MRLRQAFGAEHADFIAAEVREIPFMEATHKIMHQLARDMTSSETSPRPSDKSLD